MAAPECSPKAELLRESLNPFPTPGITVWEGSGAAQASPAPKNCFRLLSKAGVRTDSRSSPGVSRQFLCRLRVPTNLTTTKNSANYLSELKNPKVPLGLNLPEPISSEQSSTSCREVFAGVLGAPSPLSWCTQRCCQKLRWCFQGLLAQTTPTPSSPEETAHLGESELEGLDSEPSSALRKVREAAWPLFHSLHSFKAWHLAHLCSSHSGW